MFSLPVFLWPDLARHRMVRDRRVERHDDRVSRDGLGQHGLGQSVRPLRPAPRRADRVGHLAVSLALASRATSLLAVSAHLRLARRRCSIAAIFAPMMACVTGWFDTHRSLAVSLVSAGMGMAPMTMSPFAAWLVSIYDWRTSLLIIAGIVAAADDPGGLLVRRPPALDGGMPPLPQPDEPRVGDVGGAGAAIAAVHHPAADQFLLLRHALRPDLPHGELCGELRHPADHGGFDLQRGRPGGAGRPYRLRLPRRPVRREARAGHRAAGAGVRRARLFLRARSRRVLRGRRRCSASSTPASCRSTP